MLSNVVRYQYTDPHLLAFSFSFLYFTQIRMPPKTAAKGAASAAQVTVPDLVESIWNADQVPTREVDGK